MVRDNTIKYPIKSLLLPICYRLAFVDESQQTLSMTTPVMLGDNSGLDPPLPISNRAVKRTSANDSMLFACESRSFPSYLYQAIVRWFTKNLITKVVRFYCLGESIVKRNIKIAGLQTNIHAAFRHAYLYSCIYVL